MTQRIYETDSSISEFYATVTSCNKAENGYEITLSRTAFFPTGGGQRCDTGEIGDAKISDVFLFGNEVIHLSSKPLNVGVEYLCRLDYDERLKKMRSHTAEHILSSFFASSRGLKNVGFHLGSLDTTCDFDGEITESDISEAEIYVNSVIMENHPVFPLFPSEKELKELSYRSKGGLDGQIRLICIGENGKVDLCACCAPHVKSTGQIGFFIITDFYRYKGGTRVHLLTGDDAVGSAQTNAEAIKEISVILSEKTASDAVNAVKKLLYESKELRFELRQSKLALCSQIARRAQGISPFIYISENDDMEFIQALAFEAAKSSCLCAVFGGRDNEYRFAVCGEGSRELFERMKASFAVKGGGRDMLCGSIRASKSDIEALLTV